MSASELAELKNDQNFSQSNLQNSENYTILKILIPTKKIFCRQLEVTA